MSHCAGEIHPRSEILAAAGWAGGPAPAPCARSAADAATGTAIRRRARGATDNRPAHIQRWPRIARGAITRPSVVAWDRPPAVRRASLIPGLRSRRISTPDGRSSRGRRRPWRETLPAIRISCSSRVTFGRSALRTGICRRTIGRSAARSGGWLCRYGSAGGRTSPVGVSKTLPVFRTACCQTTSIRGRGRAIARPRFTARRRTRGGAGL